MAATTQVYHRSQYDTLNPLNEANNQIGRTVLITGGGTGIGFAIAKAFIQAQASQVILCGRRQETLDKATQLLVESAAGTSVKSYTCDLGDRDSIKNLWQKLSHDHINVNILVLNAADSSPGPIVPLESFLPKFSTAFETNLFANAYMTEHFLKNTSEGSNSPKALINIASFMAHSNPAPFQAAYATSKAAFAHMLQLLADEVPVTECQIVNVHPGAILTESVGNAPKEMLEVVAWDDISLPAAFAVWATTKQASFLHGRFTWANWDVDEMMSWKEKFADPGFLKLGLQGAEHVDIRTIFAKIRA